MTRSLLTSLTLNHAEIAAHIPHQGRMCLLDTMLSASETDIVCSAVSHQSLDNPLRSLGRLGSAIAAEYAAQAMALHGGLLDAQTNASSKGKGGRLINLRELVLHRERFDDVSGPIEVRASRLMGDAANVIYSFEVHADNARLPIAHGRAGVMLVVGEASI